MHHMPYQSFIRKMVGLLFIFLFLGLTSGIVPAAFAATTSTSTLLMYVDQKLGFSLQLPASWVATPQPGRAKNNNSSVSFTNTSLAGTIVQISVMRSPTASIDFAQRGKPTTYIGNYPTFQANTSAGQQVAVPCLVRIMLAHNDTVIASWCAPDAVAHTAQFESILVTYTDHSGTSKQQNMLAQAPVNQVLNCGQVIQNPGPQYWLQQGYTNPVGDSTWGQQVVNPTDSTWTSSFGEGVAVCNNYYSGGGYEWEHSYLFQCVELANRFINEEWGLKEFDVDAFAYYDNYQNGSFVQGEAKTFFGSQIQQIDDASQGNNSALPTPGDLVIFQDVNDGVNWTSGQIAGDPGHVVVVTSVTSSQVNVVQQNWHNGETWHFALQHLGNGYHIVDNSGWPGRITRGWIHFGKNSGHIYALAPDKGQVSEYSGSGTTWTKIGDAAGTIFAGNYGAFATNPTSGDIYKYNGSPMNWTDIGQPAGLNLFSRYAVTNNGVFASTPQGVFQYSGSGTTWTQIGTPSWAIYGGGYGLFATDINTGDIYKYNGTPNSWTQIGAPGTMFAVTNTGLYGLSSTGVYLYSGSGTNWTQIGVPSGAIYAAGGTIFATDINSGVIYSYNGSGTNWTQIGTPAANIYGGSGSLLATDLSTGNVLEYMGTPMNWTQIGGPGAMFVSGA